jgi:hypothetical protein
MSVVEDERGCVVCVRYKVLEYDTHNQQCILSNRRSAGGERKVCLTQ